MYGKDTFTSLLSTFIHFLCRGNRWCRICLRRLFKKKVIVYILYTVGYNKRSQQTPCSYLMFSTGHEQLIFLIKSHTFFGLITYLPYCTLNFCTIVCTRRDIARIFIFLEISSSISQNIAAAFFFCQEVGFNYPRPLPPPPSPLSPPILLLLSILFSVLSFAFLLFCRKSGGG